MREDSGTASSLLWEVKRILSECTELPQILLMENVTQVHSKKNLSQFEEWIKFLKSLGYSNFWQDMNAKDYGTPQSRNRTFMVSILDPTHQVTFEFPKPVELNSEFEDALVDEDTVADRFYIDTPRASQLIQKLIDDGVLVTSRERERERVAIDLSLNNPKQKKVANCITAHLTKDGNWIERRRSKNNGVVVSVKKNETSTL
jgi:site-specific DNA-cytosine methylase